MDLQASYPSIKVLGKQSHLGTSFNRPAPQSASSDCPGSLYGEYPIEGEASEVPFVGLLDTLRSGCKGIHEAAQTRAI
jgi:hypothetical protein